MSELKEKKIEDLRWVRVLSPDVIPKYLVEQVRDRQFEVEDFYKYHSLNCMVEGKINPFNHLYAMADQENFVKGFLWFMIDPMTKIVFINTFSVDPDYWYNGKAVKYLIDHMKNLLKKIKLEKVMWVSRYPKHSERYGFKRSKGVLMEYTLCEEEKDGRCSNDSGSSKRGLREGSERTADGEHKAEEHQHAHAGAAESI